jgi:tyrosyl-tRNA synthetase
MPLVIDPKAVGFLVISVLASTVQGDGFQSIIALAGFVTAKVGKPSKRRVETAHHDAHENKKEESTQQLRDVLFSSCLPNKKQSTSPQ